jgi:phage terminase large subunit-like protein
MSARDRVSHYVTSVLESRIPTGGLIFAACQRFERDLNRTDLYMDWDSVERLSAFFDGLTLVGDDSGRKFTLADWQLWALANLWGWRWVEDDRRRVKLGMLQVARGNGKTTLMAGLCLWDLVQGEGRRVHVIANSEHQAEICLDTAKTMVVRMEDTDMEPKFLSIVRKDADCEASALPALERSLDGLNPSLWIADEAAEFKGRFLTKLLTTGSKRRESLGVIISTPGSQADNIYGELVANGEAILRGEVEDDTVMPILYGIDGDDELDDVDCWAKANPGLEYGQPDMKSLRRAWNTMKTSPVGRAEFCRYHAARLSENSGGWLDMSLWPRHDPVDWGALRGRSAWCGLDLSKNLDMTALIVAVPLDDGRVAIRGHYWWPKVDVAQREMDYRLPVRTWAAEGRIELTPGREIDYEAVRTRLKAVLDEFNVQQVAYDRWGSKYLVEVLEADGVPMQTYSMGISTFGPGCQLWQQLWAGGKILCGDDPILRAACRTAIAKRDHAGNIRLTKDSPRRIIDPLVAAVMAVHSWGGQSESIYESM